MKFIFNILKKGVEDTKLPIYYRLCGRGLEMPEITKTINAKIIEITEYGKTVFMEYDCRMIGLFIYKEPDNRILAINNTENGCLYEYFQTMTSAYIWLSGLLSLEVLRVAEQLKEWY